MQDAQALLILQTAHDLSTSNHDTMRGIARAAIDVIPGGPVAVVRLDGYSNLDPSAVHFEGADEEYVSRFFEWQRMVSVGTRQYARSLGPMAVNLHTVESTQLPSRLEAIARQVLPLCVMANTGDGSGLYILFANPRVRDWLPMRLHYFHELAHALAAAWRIRKALQVVDARPPASHAAASDEDPGSAVVTARDALRCLVLAQDHRAGPRPATQLLWQALLAGQWSLLDTVTAAGTRHVIACKNPEGGVPLRALHPRERAVLELALAGRSGKWIAFELQLSESTVARTLRTALRRIGVTSTAALVGVPTAEFEPLEGLAPSVELAVARLMPAASSVGLSDAEQAIVTGILGGKRVAAIARERGTSPRTVSNQIASVYRKLGVSSRREVIALLT